jgi:hypothetical protein
VSPITGRIGWAAGVALLLAACGSAAPATTVPSSTVADTATTSTTPLTITTTTRAPTPRISAYFVGNSLTGGTLGAESGGYRSWYVLVTQADHVVNPLGWHIRCGSSLIGTYENPADTCVDPDPEIGDFQAALPGTGWDFVSFQPYPGGGSTFSTDLAVIEDLSAALDPDTTVLIFTGWPRVDGFTRTWEQDLEVDGDTPTVHARAYFDRLIDELDRLLPNRVVLVPSAEVLHRLDAELAEGKVPGMSGVEDLFGDDVHLSSLGNWVSGVTLAAVVLDEDPATFGKPSDPWYGNRADYSPEFIALVRRVVAEVLAESAP